MCEEVKYCICMHKFYYRYSIGQNVAIHRFIAVDGVLAVTSFVLGYFLVRIGSGVGPSLGVVGLGFGMGA